MTSVYVKRLRTACQCERMMTSHSGGQKKTITTLTMTKVMRNAMRFFITLSSLILATLRFGCELTLTQLPMPNAEEMINDAKIRKADGRGIKRSTFPPLRPYRTRTSTFRNLSQVRNLNQDNYRLRFLSTISLNLLITWQMIRMNKTFRRFRKTIRTYRHNS